MRPPRLVGWIFLVAAGFAGCSKDPTLVNIAVSADDTVPAVTTLQVTLTQSGAQRSNLFRSVLPDIDGGIEPFQFPANVEFNFAGAADAPATITIQAIDGSGNTVIASGTGTVNVKPHESVGAAVLLTAPAPGSPGGGADASGDGTDASAPDDSAGPDAAGDGATPQP